MASPVTSARPTYRTSRKIPSDGSLPGLTAIGTTQSLASVDALEEFRVLASSYSAEYGGVPGGQFALTTRSGAETGPGQVHGDVYDYVRNSYADAIDWFSKFNAYKDTMANFPFVQFSSLNYRQNDFGGTLGGPMILRRKRRDRDKTFLFVSFEAVHGFQPTAILLQYIPSGELIQERPLCVATDFERFRPPEPREQPFTPVDSSCRGLPSARRSYGHRHSV